MNVTTCLLILECNAMSTTFKQALLEVSVNVRQMSSQDRIIMSHVKGIVQEKSVDPTDYLLMTWLTLSLYYFSTNWEIYGRIRREILPIIRRHALSPTISVVRKEFREFEEGVGLDAVTQHLLHDCATDTTINGQFIKNTSNILHSVHDKLLAQNPQDELICLEFIQKLVAGIVEKLPVSTGSGKP